MRNVIFKFEIIHNSFFKSQEIAYQANGTQLTRSFLRQPANLRKMGRHRPRPWTLRKRQTGGNANIPLHNLIASSQTSLHRKGINTIHRVPSALSPHAWHLTQSCSETLTQSVLCLADSLASRPFQSPLPPSTAALVKHTHQRKEPHIPLSQHCSVHSA